MAEKEPFALVVTTGFDETGTWVIDLRVEDVDPDCADAGLLGHLRLAVAAAVIQAGGEGRARNADRVRVHLDRSLLDLDSTLAAFNEPVH